MYAARMHALPSMRAIAPDWRPPCMCVCTRARAHAQEDVDKFIDGRSKILLGDEPRGSSSGEEGEDDVDVVGLGGGAGDSEESSEEDGSWWGKKKSDYYDADEAEGSDDERQEEAEARKLQQKRSAGLRAEDFGDDQIESSDDDADSAAKPSLGDTLAGKDAVTKRAKAAGKADRKTDGKASKPGAKGDKVEKERSMRTYTRVCVCVRAHERAREYIDHIL